ncbi:MAG: hypothetical protein L6V86_09165 [Treponema sp.]|nr:MAG: hypothetical protein L6V86_09165 [Treponema sp.]
MKKSHGVIVALFAAVALLSCKVDSSSGGGGGNDKVASEPVITEQPQAATYQKGADKVNFLKINVQEVTDGGTLSYQWYKDGKAIKGAIKNSVAPDVTTVGSFVYYCAVTNTLGKSTASTESERVTISVIPVNQNDEKIYAAVPLITEHPVNATYKSGAVVSALKVTAEVKAEGNALKGDVKYQWYEDGEKIASATSASYQPFATAPEVSEVKEYKYYCEVTNDYTATATGDKKTASAKSAEVTITVEPKEITYAAVPSITENPANTTYKSGASVSALKVTAEVKAEGNALKGDVKYQWYEDGEKIASATSASYQPFATAPEVGEVKEYKYYCEVTNDCTATATGDIKTASAKSAEVTITVEPKENSKTYAAVPSITENPANTTYKSGAVVSALKVTAEVKAEGNALKGDVTYQWYKDGEKIASATSASYQPFATAPEVGEVKEYKYYCEVTNDCTATATGDKKTASAKSMEVTITVEPKEITYAAVPSITEHPAKATYKSGASVSALKVTAEVKAEGKALKGVVTYQWYKDGKKIDSATSASYQPFATAPEVGEVKEYKYYCEVTNDCTATATGDIKTASAKSAEVIITVEPKSVQQPVTPVFSKNLKSAINAEESATLFVEATVADGGALTYRLYKDNLPSGSDQTSGSFTVTTSGTYYIKAINTLNGSSASQDSNKCVVTITGKPTDGTGDLGFNFGEQSKLSKIEFISGTSVKNGEILILTVRATYEDGTSAEVFPAYSLDNTEIAVVQNGYILKGISAGTVNITATYTEDKVTKTASVKITVTDGNGGGSGSGSASSGFNFVP